MQKSDNYSVINSRCGYVQMPLVNLKPASLRTGNFSQSQTSTQSSTEVLLEAHNYTATEALDAGIIGVAIEPKKMFEAALHYG
jgi:hypothetical protein